MLKSKDPAYTRQGSTAPRLTELPVVTDSLLADITMRIVKACDPEKVILFGSRARGTARTESDVDLFVVMKPKNEQDTNHSRVMNIRAVANVPLVPLDVIVRTPQEVETRVAMGDFFIKEIMDKGKVLYQRASVTGMARQGRG